MTHPGHDAAGYEAVAGRYLAARSPTIGVTEVRRWARRLPAGAAVLDLGCGGGDPLARTLAAAGLAVYGVDASATLVAEFRRRLPGVPVACEPAETSELHGRRFDGVLAWGLLFLLDPAAQRALVARLGTCLLPGGSLLFTAPAQACVWTDMLTGRSSTSLGATEYRTLLSSAGLVVVAEYADEAGNHYFEARRPAFDPPLAKP